MKRISGAARLACACALACALAAAALSGCSGGAATVDEESPTALEASFSASSDMTEASQRIDVAIEFDAPVQATGDVLDDLEVTLNGAAVDSDAVALEASASGSTLTISLVPAEGASDGPSSGGSYFAVYSGQISISAARDDGALPHLTGEGGSCAVLPWAVEGTLPSGLAIEVVSSTAGSSEDGTLAQVTFQVTSPALVRCITWFSLDGGQTLVLKHNHSFATSDAQDCAEDLASAINDASGLDVTASARGDEVTLIATEVVDGQVLEPAVVEGVGVVGGTYDASEGM